MVQVREVMTTQVLTLTPDTRLRDALDTLSMRHIGGAPVVSGGKIVGVVSATDLMSFAASLPGVPAEHASSDEWGVFAEPPLETDVDQENETASAYFSELWDDAGAEVTERVASVEGPEWNVLEEHDVGEMMTRGPLVTVAPTADLESVADLMIEKGVHRVLVTDGDALVGIVSTLDVTKAVAEHRLTRRTYVFNHDREFRNAE